MALVRRNEYDWVDIRIGHSTGRVPQAEFYQNYLLQVSHRLRRVEPDPQWSHEHEFGAVGTPCDLLQGSLPRRDRAQCCLKEI